MSGATTRSASPVGGRYELAGLVASGGMGTIHRAFDRLAQRNVAYKRLRISLEANRARLTAMFQSEYDALARLDHPNIVDVYDYGVDEQGPYYTMELLTGEDLSRVAPPGIKETCRILRDVASALALIHARRLLHRDVSPNNVRLTGHGRAKLMDFGALTTFGGQHDVVGTPAFMAPECLEGHSLDEGIDLFSLGALGYWMLTRRNAYRPLPMDEMPRSWRVPVVPPSRWDPEIPSALDDLLLSLLQLHRQARPASAALVIERLTELAGLAPEERELEVAMSYLKHPPLRGRERELSVFHRAVDALVTGSGDVLMIEAVAGMGRSALLDQLGVDAQLRGATVLRAAGTADGVLLSVVSQLLKLGLATFPDLSDGLRQRGSLLVAAGPSTTPPAPAANNPVAAAERNARRAAAIASMLLTLSLRGPLVLIVDDAQWADDASLALLASMVEAIRNHPIVLLVSRERSALGTTAEVSLHASAKVLQLGALLRDDLLKLLRTMFGDVPNQVPLAHALHAETGGNPAACLELLRILIQRGLARYSRGTFTLPPDVPDVVRVEQASTLERVSGLSADARLLMNLLSISGKALDLEALSSATSVPMSRTLAAMSELTKSSLLVGHDARYGIASRALQQALRSSLERDTTRTMHLALARVLSHERTLDFEQSCEVGLHLMRAGGEEELQGANLIAAATYENSFEAATSSRAVLSLAGALEVLTRHGHRDRDCVHLLIPLSIAGFYGELQAQRRYLERTMHALFAACRLATGVRLRPWMGGRVALIVGILYAAALRWVSPERRYGRSIRQHLEAYLNVLSAGIAAATNASDAAEAERIARWLDPFAHAAPSSGLQVSRQFCLATVEVAKGRRGAALSRFAVLLQQLDGPVLGLDDRVRTQLRIGSLYATAHLQTETAPQLARESARIIEREGSFFAGHAEVLRMACCLYRGEHERAEVHRKRAEILALRGGVSWAAMTAVSLHSLQASVLTDDLILLVRTMAELERISELSPEIALYTELALAHLLCLRGRPDEALPHYLPLLERSLGNHTLYRVASLSYVRALTDLGNHAQAFEQCECALATLQEDPADSLLHMQLLQQLAVAQSALGKFEAAKAVMSQCLVFALATGSPLAIGLAHRDFARIALLTEDRDIFERELAAMDDAFRPTRHPSLVQQCERLAAQGTRNGLQALQAAGPAELFEPPLHETEGETATGELDQRTVDEGHRTGRVAGRKDEP